ncbi:hypothetical protein WV31_07475 [Magnetospirillum sp. ME-1]|uniref:hypothetical protein n=1 Tax=Magnetospirillum sp. ME-1 TaxID=1639348 RepID=UPI000A179B55|nr:hypothetical protein [Magnetospirillum sp. ME-1]ARJ65504.1 hypothetical protein WV31_07475 [Magnetospirillum sp. ME-1]
MANLGNLTQVAERGGLPVLRGLLVSMVLETDIAIDPSGELSRKDSPIFRVRLKTPSGRPFDAGTAYRNEIKTGENAGGFMWSIRIAKQPGIPDGMDLVAWPDGEGWYLAMGGNSAPASRPASAPADDVDGDAIPF